MKVKFPLNELLVEHYQLIIQTRLDHTTTSSGVNGVYEKD